MRSKNVIKSLIAFFIYEFVAFAANIIFPRLIILTYGSAVNGLSATITRTLSLINLVQAGAVGAAIFQMYEPVAKNDYITQSEIIYSSKKYYGKITIIYFVLSLFVGGIYSRFLNDSHLLASDIFFAFAIMTINGALQLYITSLCDIYFAPHQKKYFVTLSQIVYQVINYGCLTVALINNFPYIFIYISILIGGIVGSALNLVLLKKHSRGIIIKDPPNKQYKIPDKKYLMMSCIGSEIMTAAPTVIVTTLNGLLYASAFSIYSLVFVSMKTLLSTIQLSVSPIFGNLTKTSDDAKLYRVYDLIELITIMFGTLLAVCSAALIIPFVQLYTKDINDAEYLFPILAVFVVFYICIFTVYTSFGYVSTVYGLFVQTCKIALASALIGVIISVLCNVFLGMPYVMLGLLVNQLINLVATLHILRKNIKWYKPKSLARRSIFMFVATSTSLFIFWIVRWNLDKWSEWIICALFIAFLAIIVIAVYCILFENKQIKDLFKYAKQVIKAL